MSAFFTPVTNWCLCNVIVGDKATPLSDDFEALNPLETMWKLVPTAAALTDIVLHVFQTQLEEAFTRPNLHGLILHYRSHGDHVLLACFQPSRLDSDDFVALALG